MITDLTYQTDDDGAVVMRKLHTNKEDDMVKEALDFGPRRDDRVLRDEIDDLAARVFVALASGSPPVENAHLYAFGLAEAFIRERERRRGRLPSQR